jgi:ribosomal protein S12 methylthiotransferase
VSRPIDEVMREAERLVRAGVKELLVISQDTSAYGADLRYAPGSWRGHSYATRFIDLARALGELGVWVRLHYVYPYPHVDKVIPLMAEKRVLPYLDIPFEHGSASVLKRMRRPAHSVDTLARIQAWRRDCPDLTLRSTFIVGFPGETEAEFAELLAWLDEAQLDRVGCFKYSPVAGAAANALPDHVAPQLQEERTHATERAADQCAAAGHPRRQAPAGARGPEAAVAIACSEADPGRSMRGADRGRRKTARRRLAQVSAADAYDLTGRLAP